MQNLIGVKHLANKVTYMNTILTKTTKKVNDFEKFSSLLEISGNGDLEELWEYNIPQPHEYQRNGNTYTIRWHIDGVFWTMRGIEYINDILVRFAITLQTNSQTIKTISKTSNPIKLKHFQNLRSINKTLFNANHTKYDDSVFWALKLFVEYQIKEGANFVAYDSLESYAFTHFVDIAKDRSTLRAKCRNIWHWYNDRDWKSGLREKKYANNEEKYKGTKMTRVENINKQRAIRQEKTRRKVFNALSGLYCDEYKKKNGTWNVAKIARELNINKRSVTKYIQEFNQTN